MWFSKKYAELSEWGYATYDGAIWSIFHFLVSCKLSKKNEHGRSLHRKTVLAIVAVDQIWRVTYVAFSETVVPKTRTPTLFFYK